MITFLLKFVSCGFLFISSNNTSMKKLLFVYLLGIVISASVSAQPQIKFNDTRHEFGDVPDGSFPTWIFKFVNSGNQDLTITEVKASCGCTSPQWTREPIKPGDSGEVKVVFNSNGYAGRPFAKNVNVITNAIENGQPKQEFLFIQGKVVPKVIEPPQYPVKFSEQKHDLGTLKPGKKATWPVMIMNDGDSTLIVRNILSSCPCITFKKGDVTIAPHSSVVINATLATKGIAPKTLNENIKVATNIPVTSTKALSDKGLQVTCIIAETPKKK
jgi:hypothetical protein